MTSKPEIGGVCDAASILDEENTALATNRPSGLNRETSGLRSHKRAADGAPRPMKRRVHGCMLCRTEFMEAD